MKANITMLALKVSGTLHQKDRIPTHFCTFTNKSTWIEKQHWILRTTTLHIMPLLPNEDPSLYGSLPLMTRDTYFLMTRDTHSHPDYPYSDFPKSTRGALLLFGLPQGETHDTHKHNIRTTRIASGRPTYTIRICLSRSLTEVSKSCTSSQHPAMTHVLPPAEWKDKNEVTTSHFPRSLTAATPPTISVSRP